MAQNVSGLILDHRPNKCICEKATGPAGALVKLIADPNDDVW